MKVTERSYSDPSAAYEFAAKAKLVAGVYRITVDSETGGRFHPTQYIVKVYTHF